MRAAAALILSLRTLALAADFQGLAVSPGAGGAVTARITFDKAKAKAGGLILILPRAEAEDEDAIRLSEALVATSGDLSSRASQIARRHGVASILLDQALWEKGPVLSVEEPIFGAARQSSSGFFYQTVEKRVPWKIKEGDVASVDAARGTLRLYPPAAQERELSLAMALRAYEGLRDPRALRQWFEGRAAQEADSGQLCRRLFEEMAERAADGRARTEDFSKIREAILAGSTPEARRGLDDEGREILAGEAKVARQDFDEAREALEEAGTERAAAHIREEVEARWKRLESLAKILGASAQAASAAHSRAEARASAALKKLRGKSGGALSEVLASAGVSRPETVALSSDVYRRFSAERGLEPLIAEIGEDASLSLARKSERIRSLMLAAKLSADSPLGKDIMGMAPAGDLLLVAGADGPSIYATRQDLLSAVKEAWASYWSPAAMGKRRRAAAGLEPEADVSVRKVEAADASGLAYTRDPATGSRKRIQVDAVFGEKEGLLSGEAASDQYVLDRGSGRELFPALLADKREKFVLDAKKKGLIRVPVPPGLSLRRALSESQLVKLARAARALDNDCGCGQEFEFSFSGDKLFVAKSRPIKPPAASAGPSTPPR